MIGGGDLFYLILQDGLGGYHGLAYTVRMPNYTVLVLEASVLPAIDCY